MQKQRGVNAHNSTEGWLRALIDELRPLFSVSGLDIPEKIRGAIAFTSQGKPGRGEDSGMPSQWPAECWPAAATDDGFVEIIIRADFDEPLLIAGLLVHELVHACLPDAKHGKAFRDAALRLGLEGQMRRALPGKALQQRLNDLLERVGPLPRARLNFDRVTVAGLAVADKPKKQTTRMLKAECLAPGCGYTVRLAARWLKDCGAPHCPLHGEMHAPDVAANEDDADDIADAVLAEIQPAPDPVGSAAISGAKR